jgi:alkylhydroperoxidase/carboxymuconolactone decarboxylase family protein YurZ
MKNIVEEPAAGAWWRTEDSNVWRQVWQEYIPGLYEALRGRYTQPGTPRALDQKARELIVVAVDCVVAWPYPFIDSHVHGAFDHGATVLEILETVNVAGVFGGIHAVNAGTRALVRVVRERQEKNEPAPRSRSESLSPDGTAATAVPIAEEPWLHLLRKYDPARAAGLESWRRMVFAHRDLDVRTRELIVIALASHVKVSPTSFAAHMQAALDAGSSVGEIVEVLVATAHLEGIHTIEYGLTILDAVVQARKST